MKLRILNDLHVGAARSAGTTPQSAWHLRQHLLTALENLLPAQGDLMILGDLFDQHNIPYVDLLATYRTLQDWVSSGTGTLYLVAGNHDLSKTSTVLSSFHFLCEVLGENGNVVVCTEPKLTPWGYVIPHVPNQALFDLELSRVPECQALFLHCNYDNNFAAQSDQSLNLSREQAENLPVKRVVIGHEHHARVVGKIVLPGNQVSSSVSDWLQPTNKMFVELDEEGAVTYHEAANKVAEFIEMDWKALEVTEHKFIRVTGEAQPDETTRMMSAINKYRNLSSALVIANAVKVKTEDGSESFAEALESVKSFDIWDAFKKIFTEEELAKLQVVGQKANLC